MTETEKLIESCKGDISALVRSWRYIQDSSGAEPIVEFTLIALDRHSDCRQVFLMPLGQQPDQRLWQLTDAGETIMDLADAGISMDVPMSRLLLESAIGTYAVQRFPDDSLGLIVAADQLVSGLRGLGKAIEQACKIVLEFPPAYSRAAWLSRPGRYRL